MATTRLYGGQTAGERRAERQVRLIDAAIDLYGRLGYRNVGVRAICQQAGLTERYFYESFANSEALLTAAYERVVDLLIDDVRAAGADLGLPAVDRARMMLLAYYEGIRSHPQAARVFLIETIGVNPSIDLAFKRSLDRFGELLLDTHDPARIGPLAAEPLLCRAVVGGLHHIALAWLEAGFDRALDEVAAAAMPLCLLATPAADLGRPHLHDMKDHG